LEKTMTTQVMTEVLLEGGPADIPRYWRPETDATAEHIRVPRLAGYEHFEPTGRVHQVDDREVAIYRWMYRTRVAE
jgi:hypothetical protein